jgi:hypothetical protein
MDLVGMGVRKMGAQAKFTILNRPNGSWSSQEVSKLTNQVEPIGIIHGHPKHPSFLVVQDEHSKNEIAAILGTKDFDHKVVTGFDNPELPFIIALI